MVAPRSSTTTSSGGGSPPPLARMRALVAAAAVAAAAVLPCAAAIQPAAGVKPTIVMHLADDFGWANAGWHRPEGYAEVKTPSMDAMVREGIELDQAYAYKFCSPTRSSLQSGRLPVHVNSVNLDPSEWNAADRVSGFSGIPRNSEPPRAWLRFWPVLPRLLL
jgi:hypothetical protein